MRSKHFFKSKVYISFIISDPIAQHAANNLTVEVEDGQKKLKRSELEDDSHTKTKSVLQGKLSSLAIQIGYAGKYKKFYFLYVTKYFVRFYCIDCDGNYPSRALLYPILCNGRTFI